MLPRLLEYSAHHDSRRVWARVEVTPHTSWAQGLAGLHGSAWSSSQHYSLISFLWFVSTPNITPNLIHTAFINMLFLVLLLEIWGQHGGNAQNNTLNRHHYFKVHSHMSSAHFSFLPTRIYTSLRQRFSSVLYTNKESPEPRTVCGHIIRHSINS